jgi:hypothetical protein
MPVTGRDIIEEVVQRMRVEAEPLRYSTLAHGVYRVFMHREDYDRLAPARRSIVEEATRALDEELERLNAGRVTPAEQWGRLLKAATKLVRPVEPPVRRPPGGWVIELHPDEDEDLPPGHFRLTSELALPVAAPGLGGDPTHRVQPLNAGDATRRTTRTISSGEATAAWGELTYRDNLGREHTARLERDEIRIGRGGRDTLVDVTIEGPEDVSRVHAVLRRDGTGGVLLKDVSRFGTTLDNERVPPSLDAAGRDADRWVPVGAKSQIGLAGVIVVHFRTMAPS